MRLIGIARLLRLCQKNSIQRAYRHSGKFSEITTTLYHQVVDGAGFEGSLYASAAEHKSTLRIAWNCWTGALSQLGVARANALAAKPLHGADSDAARLRALAAYNAFFILWKVPNLPIQQQARAEYSKLQ